MPSNYSIKYCVDIVMCIDATGSMGPLLDTVKNNALRFYDDLMATMKVQNKTVHQVRVKVIAFRDYLADGENAMLDSDFFTLPEQAPAFERLVRGIQADGGGDDPEDGLEALAFAMKSDWTKGAHKRRQIIIVWTDEATHPIGFGSNPENGRNLTSMCGIPWEQVQRNAARYPQKLPRDFDQLTDWWGDEDVPGIMDNEAKRLLLYTPDKKFWTTISKSWNNVLQFHTEAGKGLKEVEYQNILDMIVRTV